MDYQRRHPALIKATAKLSIALLKWLVDIGPSLIRGIASFTGQLALSLVESLVQALSTLGSRSVAIGKAFANGIIDIINTQVIGRINSLLEFKVGPITVNPPDIKNIPRLAAGGIVSSPTLALIGEAGPEKPWCLFLAATDRTWATTSPSTSTGRPQCSRRRSPHIYAAQRLSPYPSDKLTMAYTAPTVNYSTTLDGTYTSLTGVQSINIRRGRTYFQDNWLPSQCVVELIPANTYATPLAIGQYIDVRTTNSASSEAYFLGIITDVERVYDIPYDASATLNAPGDRIIITAVGPTGMIAARTIASLSFGASTTTRLQAKLAASGSAFVTVNFVPTTQSSLTAITNQGAFDVINQLARTDQSVLMTSTMNARLTLQLVYLSRSLGITVYMAD
jgi:hypothetical protein